MTERRTARPERGAGGKAPRALVVDDAEGIRTFLANLLELWGYEVDTAADGRKALALLEAGAAPDVVLLDVMMPQPDGITTLRRIRELDPDVPVIILSVVGRASTIVEAMQLGATDYLNKPFQEEELEATLRDAVDHRRAAEERAALLREDERGVDFWEAGALGRIREVIEQVAGTDVTVLIQGESGVGKELVARAIHQGSPRRERPFVKVNCAALPEKLLESELFGYERGAFTGAGARKIGKFEIADRGTIFLDEIGEMSPALQAKLLQVLQDSEFTRLGGNQDVRVDVRVICATHRPLEQMVAEGSFRGDLFYRLNVVNVLIPPLRERREAVPGLADLFLRRAAVKYGKPLPAISKELRGELQRHAFPGNVRELENMMKRVVVLEREDVVLAELRAEERAAGERQARFLEVLSEVEDKAGELPLREAGRRVALEAEREAIERALQRTGWNRKQAAKLLHVSYKTLLQKIRECGLEPDGST